MENIENYAEELERMDTERKAGYAVKFPESWNPPQGTTRITILNKNVKKIQTESGIKALFDVSVNNIPMTWWLNTKNPTYRELLELGRDRQGGLANASIDVTRTGERKATRYAVKLVA